MNLLKQCLHHAAYYNSVCYSVERDTRALFVFSLQTILELNVGGSVTEAMGPTPLTFHADRKQQMVTRLFEVTSSWKAAACVNVLDVTQGCN